MAVEALDLDQVVRFAWPRHGPVLAARARAGGLDKQEASDLVQEVFATVAREWPGFRGTGFVPWLYRIATFEMLTHVKTRKRNRCVPEAGIHERPGDHQQPEDRIDTRRALALARDMVAQLDPIDRLVVLGAAEGSSDLDLSAAALADLGALVSVNAVAVRRHRARGRLAHALRGLR